MPPKTTSSDGQKVYRRGVYWEVDSDTGLAEDTFGGVYWQVDSDTGLAGGTLGSTDGASKE